MAVNLNDLSKQLNTAAQQAYGKTSSFIEAQKMSIKVQTAQHEIEKLYQAIGETVVMEARAEDALPVSEDVKALIDEVLAQTAKIDELKGGIAKARGVKICTSCGKKMSLTDAFCSQCGAPAPVVEEPAAECECAEACEAAEEETASEPVCCCCAEGESLSDEIKDALVEAAEEVKEAVTEE